MTPTNIPSAFVDIFYVNEDDVIYWETGEFLSEKRYYMVAATVNNKAFFAGGNKYSVLENSLSDVIDIYQYDTRLWSVTRLSSPRSRLSAATLGNIIIFSGGDITGVNDRFPVDIYDDSDGKWENYTALFITRSSMAVATIEDRYAFFIGGFQNRDPSKRVDVYDKTMNTWESFSLDFAISESVAISYRDATEGDSILLVGGSVATDKITDHVERIFQCLFVPHSPTPQPFSPIPSPTPEPAPSDPITNVISKLPTWAWIVAGIGCIIVFFVTIITVCCIFKTKCKQTPLNSYTPLPSVDDAIRIKPEDLKVKEVIGRGGFSVVYRGFWRKTPVAIKQFNQKNSDDDEDPFDTFEFLSEAKIMLNLRHPNIVIFMGICAMPGSFAIVTELLDFGSLAKILRNEDILIEPKHVQEFALDVCRGMAYLHASKIIHRDLKTRNLLVDKNWIVKVADFGLSREQNVAQTMNTMTACGTGPWIAPEVLREHHYSFASDVYSFAICLWEMCTRRKPYQNIPQYQVLISVATKGMRPKVKNSEIPGALQQTIQQCWDDDPKLRPTFEDLVQTLDLIQFPTPMHPKPLMKEKKESSGSSAELALTLAQAGKNFSHKQLNPDDDQEKVDVRETNEYDKSDVEYRQ